MLTEPQAGSRATKNTDAVPGICLLWDRISDQAT